MKEKSHDDRRYETTSKAVIDDLIEWRRENVIIDALIGSERMECTKSYLSRGRRFVGMETDEIKQRWIATTRKFQVSYGEVDPR
jgi:hypothetical protein